MSQLLLQAVWLGGGQIKVQLPLKFDALHEEVGQKCSTKRSTFGKAAPGQPIRTRAALSSTNITWVTKASHSCDFNPSRSYIFCKVKRNKLIVIIYFLF